jgi:O-antigen/teichoic acid export membrane protein
MDFEAAHKSRMERVDSQGYAPQHQKKLIYLSVLSIAVIVSGYLLKYFINLILARYLKAEVYGDFSFFINVVTFGAGILMLGADDAVLCFIPGYMAGRSLRKISGYFRREAKLLLIAVLIAVYVAAIIFSFIFVIDSWVNKSPSLDYNLILFGIWIVPLYGLVNFQSKTLRSFGSINWSLFSYWFTPILLFSGGVVIILVLSGKINIYQVLLVYGFSLLFVAMQQAIVIFSIIPRNILTIPPVYANKKWFKVSLQLFFSSLINTGMSSIAIILLEIIAPSEVEVGVFGAILTICASLLLVQSAVNIIISPIVTILTQDMVRNHQKLQRFINRCNLFFIAPGMILLLVIIFFGKNILQWFGDEFVVGYWPLVIVAAGYFFSLALGTTLTILRSSGYQKGLIQPNIIGFCATFVISAIGAYNFGIYAVAIALASGSILAKIFSAIEVKRTLKLKVFYFV